MRRQGNPDEGEEESTNPATPDGSPFQLEITDILDLHSFAPRDITGIVEAYLSEAHAKGYTTVRIIHGKGKGVQRAQIQALLRKTPWVAGFEDAPLEAGSWGATVVWFTRQSEK